jgi:hypothetical protein
MANEQQWAEAFRTYEMAKSDADEDVESDEECTLLGEAHSEATRSLLAFPSPNAAALATKLKVFRDEEMYALREDLVREVLGVLISDARGLGAH